MILALRHGVQAATNFDNTLLHTRSHATTPSPDESTANTNDDEHVT